MACFFAAVTACGYLSHTQTTCLIHKFPCLLIAVQYKNFRNMEAQVGFKAAGNKTIVRESSSCEKNKIFAGVLQKIS